MADTVRFLRLHDAAVIPSRSTEHAAGYDLSACLESPLTMEPGGRTLVPTGLSMELPTDMEGQVRPRSGLAVKHGVTVLNAPGTIDADYRGEVRVALVNHGEEPFTVEHGMRIAQLVFSRVLAPCIEESASLSETGRGSGGFGHTGV